jgi:hypothetical protein
VGPAPKRLYRIEQAPPLNYFRINGASVCAGDGDVLESGDGDMDDANEGVLRECAGAERLLLLRGEHGRGSTP